MNTGASGLTGGQQLATRGRSALHGLATAETGPPATLPSKPSPPGTSRPRIGRTPRGEKFDDYLHRAIDPIQDLYWSFEREGDRHNGSLWRHQPALLQQTKDKRLPEFMRREIEGIAGNYVKSGLKTATVDRLLVDLMVAMEFSQYAETIFRAPHLPIIAPSILKRNVFLDWFTNRILAASAVLNFQMLLAKCSARNRSGRPV